MDNVELKTLTRTVWIGFFEKSYKTEGESNYHAYLQTHAPDEGKKDEYLGTLEVSFEIPTNDAYFDELSIKKLRAQKAKIIAESRAEQQKIDEKIQSLMALPDLREK